MWLQKIYASLAMLVLLAACSGGLDNGLNILAVPQGDPRPVDVTALPPMRVTSWQVSVPETLSVSEANGIKPVADIVWRGDRFGDRHAQVSDIVNDGLARAARRINGNLPVVLIVDVERFHAVTERTRYAYSGKHEIRFGLQINNADTGAIIVPRYLDDITFRAYGGYEALDAERRGITQKSRILDQIEQRVYQELTGALAENIDESLLVGEGAEQIEGDSLLVPSSQGQT